ncbi:MAG: hypothetical protein H0W88_05290 [Parachlamydiaceae bacterium]|nr:hypothetical protein [Parachlamydiaceae bacterium]
MTPTTYLESKGYYSAEAFKSNHNAIKTKLTSYNELTKKIADIENKTPPSKLKIATEKAAYFFLATACCVAGVALFKFGILDVAVQTAYATAVALAPTFTAMPAIASHGILYTIMAAIASTPLFFFTAGASCLNKSVQERKLESAEKYIQKRNELGDPAKIKEKLGELNKIQAEYIGEVDQEMIRNINKKFKEEHDKLTKRESELIRANMYSTSTEKT